MCSGADVAQPFEEVVMKLSYAIYKEWRWMALEGEAAEYLRGQVAAVDGEAGVAWQQGFFIVVVTTHRLSLFTQQVMNCRL